MNSQQIHHGLLYPRIVLYILGIASIVFLLLDYYFLLNIEFFWRYFGFPSTLTLVLDDTYRLANSDLVLLLMIHVFLEVLFTFLFIFYAVKLVYNSIAKSSEIDKLYRADGTDESVTILNFLTYRKNGIAVYHLLTLSILLIHFIGGQLYIIRLYRSNYVSLSEGTSNVSPEFSFVYTFLLITIMTLVLITFAMIFLKDKLSLDRLTYLLDRILLLIITLAYLSMTFIDIEGYYLAGTIFTYSLLLLSLFKISKVPEFKSKFLNTDNNSSNPSQSLIIIIAFGAFMLILSFIIFSINTQSQIPSSLFSLSNFLYFFLMNSIIIITALISKSMDIDKVQEIIKYVTILTFLLFFSIFIYDDLMFAIDEFGENNSLNSLGSFILLQLPTSFLIGLLVSIGYKLSKQSK